MTGLELIPRDVLLDEAGHLSEVGVTVLGDGQSMLVPADVLQHVDGCADCCQRMGDAAMFSLALGDALREAAAKPVLATVHELAPAAPASISKRDSFANVRRLPVPMMVAALVAACIGLAPTLYSAPAWLTESISLFHRLVPILAKSSYLLLKRGGASAGPLVFVLPFVSAMVLMAVGLVVAKRLPRVVMIGRGV